MARRQRAHALLARAVPALAALLLVVACGSARDAGRALDPRFVAVHNAFAALGMAQIGPIQQGTLAEGHEVRVGVALPQGCVTIAALGGPGVRNLDATLLDPHGAPLAHDTTAEAQAVLRACVEAADTYAVVLKAAAGAGAWVLASWVGGAVSAPAPAGSNGPAAQEARGTCESPIPLAIGTTTGTTAHGDDENTGSCGRGDSRELVYELVIRERQRVTIEVEARFDTVLYVRKETCTDSAAEVDCNDDGPDRTHSRIEHVLDPGKYFVFVDGYSSERGNFKLTLSASGVLALADVCRRAPVLALGPPHAGSTQGSADDAEASCGGGARGAEAAWQLDLPQRSRVRLVEHSDEMAPVVHVRRACADDRSEVVCADSGAAPGDATAVGVLDPGRYSVFADARESGSAGGYTLSLETSLPAGAGTTLDGCGDAAPLGPETAGKIVGDTFAARDDVAGSCGGQGAADVVYRLDVPRRARFGATLESEEGSHVLVLWHRCGDRSSEVACGRTLDEVLAPGAYFLAVDGMTPDALGRFTVQWALRDVTGQASACSAATLLAPGRAVDSTTVGQGDKFASSCASSDATGGAGDRVFRFALAARSHVRIMVTAPTFEATVALRKVCGDVPGGPSGELACESGADGSRKTIIERTLDPGTYWVVVDGQSATDQGAFTIEYLTR
jgi:hypothetical protein